MERVRKAVAQVRKSRQIAERALLQREVLRFQEVSSWASVFCSCSSSTAHPLPSSPLSSSPLLSRTHLSTLPTNECMCLQSSWSSRNLKAAPKPLEEMALVAQHRSVFCQAQRQLQETATRSPWLLRRSDGRAWFVRFTGEQAIDDGGLYRESLSTMISELLPESVEIKGAKSESGTAEGRSSGVGAAVPLFEWSPNELRARKSGRENEYGPLLVPNPKLLLLLAKAAEEESELVTVTEVQRDLGRGRKVNVVSPLFFVLFCLVLPCFGVVLCCVVLLPNVCSS